MMKFGAQGISQNTLEIFDQRVIILEDNEKQCKSLQNYRTASKEIVSNEDRSFLLFDLGSIIKQYERLRNLLPRVHPFFAIKCMADKQLISLLGYLDAGFDCASWDEIINASSALPKQRGAYPEKHHSSNSEKIIFSHPFKFPNEMKNAHKIGVEFTVFDTEEELYLISKHWPQAKLLLRILPPKKFNAYAQLGDKFGADKDEIKKLIVCCKSMKLNLIGICFHVGSGVEEMDAWSQTIEYCIDYFHLIKDAGFKPYLLDIGGGYPFMSITNCDTNKERQKRFEKECLNINKTLDKIFPASENYTIISEPGAFFTMGSGCLFCQVIGKIKECAAINQINFDRQAYPDVEYSYILNNSSYHSIELNASFEVYFYKKNMHEGLFINLKTQTSENKIKSRFLGNTVDECDCIIPEIEIPELFIGDWLMLTDKGAYTDVHNGLTTMFCSTTSIPHYYFVSKSDLAHLKSLIRIQKMNSKILSSSKKIDGITNSCSIL